MTSPQINRIARLELITADAVRAARFYCGLGFQPSGTPGTAIRLRLGEQEIALVELPAAAPYPIPRAANDPWFQHFAIAVSDIDVAAALALGLGATPISTGGPQRLPPNTGSVTAWKFRDPEGHPLEFSYLPRSRWLDTLAPGPCLGIDHTAIAAGDLTMMLGFYEAMGLRETGRSLNRGMDRIASTDFLRSRWTSSRWHRRAADCTSNCSITARPLLPPPDQPTASPAPGRSSRPTRCHQVGVTPTDISSTRTFKRRNLERNTNGEVPCRHHRFRQDCSRSARAGDRSGAGF